MRKTKGWIYYWIHCPGVLALLCAVFTMLSFHTASAQTITGNIGGTVTDASGAVVAHATVKATEIKTGVVTTTTTNNLGLYNLRFLPIGTTR